MRTFRKVIESVIVLAFFIAVISGGAWITYVHAAPAGPPAAQYGAITLLAATTTQIKPAAGLNLKPRSGIAVQNLSAADIWCGFDSSVDATNGFKVAQYQLYTVNADNDGGLIKVYCYSAVLQVAPANTRWQEIRSSVCGM